MVSKLLDPDSALDPDDILHRDGLQSVTIGGPDAAGFLQRQCMNDIDELAGGGDGQWSGILSAKGRVLFLFRLYRRDADFVACLQGGEAAALRAHLDRSRFRSKLSLAESPNALDAGSGTTPEGAVRWDAGRWVRLPGTPLPTLSSSSDTASEAGPAADASRVWEQLDWARGIPRIDAALQDRFTPQMLGLQRLRAFNLKKGCYPGQEIVARTHYLGQGKRVLMRVEGDAALAEGVLRDHEGTSVGELIQRGRWTPQRGLAVMAIGGPASCMDAAGAAVQLTAPDSDTTP